MTLHTHHFVYIHMPKTGGMWVAAVLRDQGAQKIPGLQRHAPLRRVPASILEGRQSVGTIRDPWSWYTSFWQHLGAGVDGPQLRRALGDGDESFSAVLQGLLDPNRWGSLPESVRGGWPWPEPSHDSFFTSLVHWFYGNPIQIDRLLDTRTLTSDLSDLLGTPIETPPKNTAWDRPASAVKDPFTLFSEDDLALVWELDGPMSRLLGYDSPFGYRKSVAK
jgi:hypothetical protein